MTPDGMAERLAEWAATTRHIEDCGGGSLAVHELPDRRVTCVEPEGERRTWVLSEGGRQVGLVRLRLWQGAEGQREWLYEASDRTRAMLGL